MFYHKTYSVCLAVSGYEKPRFSVGHIQKSTTFHLKECNRCKLSVEAPPILLDMSYSSCMPFNTIYAAHIAALLQYIKPSESTLYLSKGSSETTVLLPGANIELTVSKVDFGMYKFICGCSWYKQKWYISFSITKSTTIMLITLQCQDEHLNTCL